ncbi:MAG: hypothetical protein JZU63_02725, partial [Rhodoferax sp.]|nr:hypothetical protein [Rhodoferax sp.]
MAAQFASVAAGKAVIGHFKLLGRTLAKALHNGNAGKVVVWSENQTQFGGHISAQGGAQAGNGGQVEVSSHQSLVQAGTIDVSAIHGNNGQVLFDPKNIEIVNAISGVSVLSLTDTVAANRNLGSSLVKELVNSTTSTSLNRIKRGGLWIKTNC